MAKSKIENIEQVENKNIENLADGSILKRYPNGEGCIISPNGFKKSLNAEEMKAYPKATE